MHANEAMIGMVFDHLPSVFEIILGLK
jgi:hypothetical protein